MLGLALLSIWLMCAVIVTVVVWRAPMGWEDRNGFHRGEPDTTAKKRGRLAVDRKHSPGEQ